MCDCSTICYSSLQEFIYHSKTLWSTSWCHKDLTGWIFWLVCLMCRSLLLPTTGHWHAYRQVKSTCWINEWGKTRVLSQVHCMTQWGCEYPSMLWGVYHNTDLMVRGRGLSDPVACVGYQTRPGAFTWHYTEGTLTWKARSAYIYLIYTAKQIYFISIIPVCKQINI